MDGREMGIGIFLNDVRIFDHFSGVCERWPQSILNFILSPASEVVPKINDYIHVNASRPTYSLYFLCNIHVYDQIIYLMYIC